MSFTSIISGIFTVVFLIILIGYYSPKVNVLLLSIIQFSVSAILNLATAFVFETVNITMITNATWPILYGGIMSIGVAYTLQVFGQQKVAPSKAAIVLSLESVFAMIGGWMLLNETITMRKGTGAILMLAGLVLSQLRLKNNKHNADGKNRVES